MTKPHADKYPSFLDTGQRNDRRETWLIRVTSIFLEISRAKKYDFN